MKFRNPSDLFLWLLVIFPACGLLMAIFQMQSLCIVLLIVGFATMECGIAAKAKLSEVMARYAVCVVVAVGLFILVGYRLMFGSSLFEKSAPDEFDVFAMVQTASGTNAVATSGTYPGITWTGVPWWVKVGFQALFCGTATLVFSAGLSQLFRPWLHVALCSLLALIVYPLFGRWAWGGGWLSAMGFHDFAGGTVVYSIAGWSALPFALAGCLDARRVKASGTSISSIYRRWLYSIGSTIVWFALAGIGLLDLIQPSERSGMAICCNLAPLAGGATSTLLSLSIFRQFRIQGMFAGAFAGVAAITASIYLANGTTRTPAESVIIGAGAGGFAALSIWLFEKLSIPDRLSIIPSFAVGGACGTIYVGLSGNSDPSCTVTSQMLGVIVALVWAGGVFGVVAAIAHWRGWLSQRPSV